MTDLFEGGAASKKPRAKKADTKPKPLEGEAIPAGSAEARTELIVAEAQANPVALFTDEKRYSEFYEKVAAEVRGHVPDVSTPKGRDEIRSLAFRVVKAKTSLDKAGLGLTEDWREKIKAVNAARSKMTGELAELAEQVRAPLTAWEEADKLRLEKVENELARFRAEAAVGEEETAADVRARGRALYELVLEPELYGERLEEARAAKDAAVASLLRSVARLEQEEKDREELEALRREKEERLAEEGRKDAARMLAPDVVRSQAQARDPDAEEVSPALILEWLRMAELGEQYAGVVAEAAKPLWAEHLRKRAEEREEAARIERERVQAEADRIAREREEAAEAAREEERQRVQAERAEEERQRREAEEEKEAARLAEEERKDRERADAEAAREEAEAERQRAAEAELAAERARAQAAEEETREAREREAERLEKERLEKEAQEARERNQKHRRAVAGEAAEDLAALLPEGMEDRERVARAIVLAIANREIRHASITF